MADPFSVAAVRIDLKQVAEPKLAAPMAADMRNRFAFFGIKTPQRGVENTEIEWHTRPV